MSGFGTSNGFGNRATQRIETYNLKEIYNNSDIFNLNFNLDQTIDRITPQLAMYTANEIQQRALTNNAARIGVFEYVSINAFNNDEFRQLVWVIANRIGYGLVNKEWRTLQEAQTAVIPRICKAYTGAYVSFNQDLYNGVVTNQNIAADIVSDTKLWDYSIALANGNAGWEPFRSNANSQATPRSVINNSPSVGNDGAFVERRDPVHAGDVPFTGSSTSRYVRNRERMNAERAADSASRPATAPGTQPRGGFGTRSMMQEASSFSRQAATTQQTQQHAAPVQLSEEERIAEERRNAKTINKATISGVEVDIIRQVPDGEKLWKPTKLQPYRAAYCKRTHFMTYFETRDGIILSFIGKHKPENKELLMNYDDHAIDPTMGRPVQNAKKNPVREEARVLYADSQEIKVNVIVKPNPTMVDSFSSAVSGALTYGRRKSNGGDPIINSSVVNTAIVMKNAADAEENLELLLRIGAVSTLKEAGPLIKKISDPQLKTLVNEGINADINTLLRDTLNIVGASVSETVDTYSDQLEDQLAAIDKEDTDYARRFADRIPYILQANTRAQKADSCPEYVDAILADHDKETADEEDIARTVLLQKNVNIAYMPFTKNEMALVLTGTEACFIDQHTLPLLNETAKALVTQSALDTSLQPYYYVVTIDGQVLELVRGGHNSKGFLIKKA